MKGSKIILIVIGIIISMSFITSCNQSSTTVVSSVSTKDSVSKTPQIVKDSIVKTNWKYDSSSGIQNIKKAYIKSANSVKFEFPYNEDDGSNLKLLLMKINNKNNEVQLWISKGQFITSLDERFNYAQTQNIMVKFDETTPVSYVCALPTDGSSYVLCIGLSTAKADFIKKLKKSKKVIIQATFFQEGSREFSFDVDGLKWD